MGGSQSARKLSVENENAIQVSQEALDRIKSQLAAKQADEPLPQYTQHNYDSHKRQEYLAEEAHWARRIENLRRAHERISNNMQLEYQKTLKEANDLFNAIKQDKIGTKLPPCQEQKAKVLQCYEQNPDKSLMCSSLVSQFNECVCQSRISALTATS